MNRNTITAYMCKLDQESPASCDHRIPSEYEADVTGIAATETDADGNVKNINIRMCNHGVDVECPYREIIESRPAPILNGRFAIALGKPPKTPLYKSMDEVPEITVVEVAMGTILKGRSPASIPDAWSDRSRWAITSRRPEMVEIKNREWSRNQNVIVRLSDDGNSVLGTIVDDLPF